MNTETATVCAMSQDNQEVVPGQIPVPANRAESLPIIGCVIGVPPSVIDRVHEAPDVKDLILEAARDAMHSYLAGGNDDCTAEDIAHADLLEDGSPEEIHRSAALWSSMTCDEQRETLRRFLEELESPRFLVVLDEA